MAVLEVEDTPTVDPPLLPHPPPPRCCPPPQCPPTHQPPVHPPWLATDEQPLAKNANIYYFALFSSFLKIFDIFCFLSALGVKEAPLGFDNRILHCF